jgi:hypothetical protein
VGDGPAVSRFLGDDISWRPCYGPDGTLDADALLELYRRTLARDGLFRYTLVQRIVFTPMHANRAIAQGCGSTKGTDRWLEAFRAAAAKFDARLVEVASQFDRRRRLSQAVDLLRSFGGARGVGYAAIYQHLLALGLGERDTHQVLLFLRSRGLVSWSSRLHRDAEPAPRFDFVAAFPASLTWDAVERESELPELRVAVWNDQSR